MRRLTALIKAPQELMPMVSSGSLCSGSSILTGYAVGDYNLVHRDPPMVTVGRRYFCGPETGWQMVPVTEWRDGTFVRFDRLQ